mmetsp:Transcript_8771/g.28879  ORF Transcript_8771/g.28879 Transcript_8771/m.28879 type:complete len:414 (+) Transcript_8771:1604-2845(+)
MERRRVLRLPGTEEARRRAAAVPVVLARHDELGHTVGGEEDLARRKVALAQRGQRRFRPPRHGAGGRVRAEPIAEARREEPRPLDHAGGVIAEDVAPEPCLERGAGAALQGGSVSEALREERARGLLVEFPAALAVDWRPGVVLGVGVEDVRRRLWPNEAEEFQVRANVVEAAQLPAVVRREERGPGVDKVGGGARPRIEGDDARLRVVALEQRRGLEAGLVGAALRPLRKIAASINRRDVVLQREAQKRLVGQRPVHEDVGVEPDDDGLLGAAPRLGQQRVPDHGHFTEYEARLCRQRQRVVVAHANGVARGACEDAAADDAALARERGEPRQRFKERQRFAVLGAVFACLEVRLRFALVVDVERVRRARRDRGHAEVRAASAGHHRARKRRHHAHRVRRGHRSDQQKCHKS